MDICKEIANLAPDLTLFYLSRVNSDFGVFKLAIWKFYDLTTRLERGTLYFLFVSKWRN
jgi:hypothetical protein